MPWTITFRNANFQEVTRKNASVERAGSNIIVRSKKGTDVFDKSNLISAVQES